MDRQKDPNHLLAELLEAAEWSAAELAKNVNALGAAQGIPLKYDRTAVAHWLTGTQPRAPVPDLVAAALTRRCGRLVTVEETGLIRKRRKADTRLADVAADPLTVLVRMARHEGHPRHQRALARSLYQPPEPEPAQWDEPVDGGPDHPATRAHSQSLARVVSYFTDIYLDQGGSRIRSGLAAFLAQDVGRTLSGGKARRPTPAQLTRYAQLGHLLAGMTLDAGLQGLAGDYYSLSLQLSRQAQDRRMYAITLRAMSSQATRMRLQDHALRLALAAVETDVRSHPATMTYLLAQRAVCRAHVQQRTEALDDLREADRCHAEAVSGSGPFENYDRAALDYQHGVTHLALGQHAEAISSLSRSILVRPAQHYRAHALTQALLAKALLHVGEITAACEHWQVFLDHYPRIRSHPADQALKSLLSDLRPYRRIGEATRVVARARSLAKRA